MPQLEKNIYAAKDPQGHDKEEQRRAPTPMIPSPLKKLSKPLPEPPAQQEEATAMFASNRNGPDEMVNSSGLARPGSIYSLSRVSFAGQLSHLTSMRLPDAASMTKRMSSIPTATEAADELSDASEQIRRWVSQASDVLDGLNADDDVEWAAAGGKDGIGDVEDAIGRFDSLVQVYIASIEELQTRKDVAKLSAAQLISCVRQMEGIIGEWDKIKLTLKGVKTQIELALEWEELWNTVLGEAGQELGSLSRLVFEMEEKRHDGAEGLWAGTVDGKATPNQSSRRSLAPSSQNPQSTQDGDSREDSRMLALFARMQPLRASLDFLPMRLSAFQARASHVFPTACEDLDNRMEQLEAQWTKLESDAESVRRELGEDRWILVFRNAGRQALQMCESVSRSYQKLREGIDEREYRVDPAAFANKVENYEAKKTHYGPAIERVMAIVDRGVADRLTVNGEVLRLQLDMRRRWNALQADMRELDATVDRIDAQSWGKQVRDSISTAVSSERSAVSSAIGDDTPGSSPPGSVMTGSLYGNNLYGVRTPSLKASYGKLKSPPAATETPGRPKWVTNPKPERRDFLPLSALEPSQYAKTPVTPKSNFLRSSKMGQANRAVSTPVNSSSTQPPPRKSSLPVPTFTQSAKPNRFLTPKKSTPALRRPSGRQSDVLPSVKVQDETELFSLGSRPPTAFASSRRSSMQPPRPRTRLDDYRGQKTASSRPAWRP
ncbi:karyogamy protein [Piedraia hortae CBS 480.64]|uniref:Karyogamy protein n=1 Tax=Piedraia hortae CBS 480.64 TaxID=1314780 RepID=A0A6A7C715_9PEZI|nr:karyogamy protein [Piedraia hortae CBS 480.64]